MMPTIVRLRFLFLSVEIHPPSTLHTLLPQMNESGTSLHFFTKSGKCIKTRVTMDGQRQAINGKWEWVAHHVFLTLMEAISRDLIYD
jgi:hypothetical protein